MRFEQLSVLLVENLVIESPPAGDLLRDLGVSEVVTVKDHDVAIQACQARVFDVLMCSLAAKPNGDLRLIEGVRRESPWTRALVTSTRFTAATLERLRQLGVEDFLERPLSHETLSRALCRTNNPSPGLCGSIHGLELSDLLHMYHYGRRSVSIRVEGPVIGEITLREGEIVDARCEGSVGLSALGRLLAITTGRLQTRPDTSNPTRSIDTTFEHSLLEALHQLDRARESARPTALGGSASRDAEGFSSASDFVGPHGQYDILEMEGLFMADQAKLTAALVRLQQAVTGFIAASVVDLETGMTLAAHSVRSDFDLGVASAYNSEMVKQKLKTIAALRLKAEFKDMLLTLSDQLHLIQMITPATFIYLAADKNVTNLAIVRGAVSSMLPELQ